MVRWRCIESLICIVWTSVWRSIMMCFVLVIWITIARYMMMAVMMVKCTEIARIAQVRLANCVQGIIVHWMRCILWRSIRWDLIECGCCCCNWWTH